MIFKKIDPKIFVFSFGVLLVLLFFFLKLDSLNQRQFSLEQRLGILEASQTRTKQLIIASRSSQPTSKKEEFFRLLGLINQNKTPKKVLFESGALRVHELNALTSNEFLDLLAFLLDEDAVIEIQLPKGAGSTAAKRSLIEFGVSSQLFTQNAPKDLTESVIKISNFF